MVNVLFLLGIFFSSCEKQINEKSVAVKYGTSFGKCIGYCKRELLLTNNTATLTLRKNTDTTSIKTCSKILDQATVTAIIKSINLNEFSELKETIGCPDCADGGAEYVELNMNGKWKRVTFERGNVPKELVEIVAKIEPIFYALNDCK